MCGYLKGNHIIFKLVQIIVVASLSMDYDNFVNLDISVVAIWQGNIYWGKQCEPPQGFQIN